MLLVKSATNEAPVLGVRVGWHLPVCRGFESGERYLRSPRPLSAEFMVPVA